MKLFNQNSLLSIIVVLTALFFTSCTLEKRVYNKGYHSISAKKVDKKNEVTTSIEHSKEADLTVSNQNSTLTTTFNAPKEDEIILKTGKTVTGSLVSTNSKTTTVKQMNETKTIKNSKIVSIKQSNDEVLVPHNGAKMKSKNMKKAIDKAEFLPNLLAIILGGAAFLIFLWLAVAFYFNPIASLILALITIGLGVTAIIFGVKGIRAGGKFKWMGIVGLATGAAACLIALIILILDIVHIAQGWKGGGMIIY